MERFCKMGAIHLALATGLVLLSSTMCTSATRFLREGRLFNTTGNDGVQEGDQVPISPCKVWTNPEPFSSIEAVEQAANDTLRSGLVFHESNAPWVSACMSAGILRRVTASAFLSPDGAIKRLCAVSLSASTAILHGTPGGGGTAEAALWEGGGVDILRLGALFQSQPRSWLLRWALEGLTEAQEVNAVALRLVATAHIAEVLDVALEVQAADERWAYWMLYGACMQIAVVTQNSTLRGTGSPATSRTLFAAIQSLSYAAPEARIGILRSSIGAVISAEAAWNSTSPPPPEDDNQSEEQQRNCSPSGYCRQSRDFGSLVMQILWAIGGSLALTLALSSVVILILRVRRNRRQQQRAIEEWNAVVIESDTQFGRRPGSGQSGGDKFYDDPDLVCTTVMMPDGQTAIAVGRREKDEVADETPQKKEEDETLDLPVSSSSSSFRSVAEDAPCLQRTNEQPSPSERL